MNHDDLMDRLDVKVLKAVGFTTAVLAATAAALVAAACMGLAIMLWAMHERAHAALPAVSLLVVVVGTYFHFRSRPWALKLAALEAVIACAGAYWWLYHTTIINYH